MLLGAVIGTHPGSVERHSSGTTSRVGSMKEVRMDGTALAATLRERGAQEVAELGHVGLTTVLVGDDPASHVYITSKHKAATDAGIDARDIRLPAETSEHEGLDLVRRLSADEDVAGSAGQ